MNMKYTKVVVAAFTSALILVAVSPAFKVVVPNVSLPTVSSELVSGTGTIRPIIR